MDGHGPLISTDHVKEDIIAGAPGRLLASLLIVQAQQSPPGGVEVGLKTQPVARPWPRSAQCQRPPRYHIGVEKPLVAWARAT